MKIDMSIFFPFETQQEDNGWRGTWVGRVGVINVIME